MMDAFDFLIAGDDAEVAAEISADKAAYAFHMRDGNIDALLKIEQKYGLVGLSPQQVTQQLHEMSLPIGGAA